MRRIVPMGIATGGIWTGNIRALRHVLEMRTTEAAEEEICFVFSNIMKRIAELEPNLFGDFEQDEFGFWKPKYHKV
jgi:thymidylate synthase (FAD)